MHLFKSISLLHLSALIKAEVLFPTVAIFQPKVVRAIIPTKSGQIGINPVSVYYETTTIEPDDPVPSRPVIHHGATSTVQAPFAVVTDTDGDIVFPINQESKPALQALFDEVTAACAGAGKKLRKRTGQCELDYLSRPGVGGGVLDFDLPGFSVPTFTMGDIAVALQGVPGAVVVAFLAYVIGQGDVVDDVAPKIPQTDVNPPASAKSESLVPTTTREDMTDSLFTASPAIYEAIAGEILERIALGDPEHLWSDDQTEIPTADCDRSEVTNVESKLIENLSAAFCANIDFTKSTSRNLTNEDANTDACADCKFNMKWEPEDGHDCNNLNCEALYSTFASSCQYNSHSMYATGKISTDCGTASFEIGEAGNEGDDGSEDGRSGGGSCTSDADCKDQPCPGFRASCAIYGALGVNPEGGKMCQCINPLS